MSQVNVSLVAPVVSATFTEVNQEVIQEFSERIYAMVTLKARDMGATLSRDDAKSTSSQFGLVTLSRGRGGSAIPTIKGLTAIGEQAHADSVSAWASANKNKADQKLRETLAKAQAKVAKLQAKLAK